MHNLYTGDIMTKNLNELLAKSSSTRKYFISLPVWLQIKLHNVNDYIHTAEQLRITADIFIRQKNLN